MGGLSQSLAGAAGALLARDVTGHEAAAGWPQAALVAGAALAALAMSRLTRTHGRKAALATGALTAVLGSLVVAASGVVGNLTGILLGSALLGAGNATVMLGRYAAAELASSVARARAMGWMLVATSVGAAAGPNLMGPSGSLAEALGLPPLTGPYVLAAAGFGMSWLLLAAGLGHAFERPPRVAQVVIPQRLRPPALGASGAAAIAVLGGANLVMVAVMTMAPIHLHDHGVQLGGIGLVVSVHIAGMFLPSPISGWATDRFGPRPVVVASGVVLALGSALAAVAAGSTTVLVSGLTLLGVGWNLALVAGSDWLTTGVDRAHKPRLEGLGEVGMGAAAALGGVVSGLVVGHAGYATLAAAGALVSLFLLPLALVGARRPAASGDGRRPHASGRRLIARSGSHPSPALPSE